jgi:hypothetical protein
MKVHDLKEKSMLASSTTLKETATKLLSKDGYYSQLTFKEQLANFG